MKALLFVFLGGGFGSICRYLLGKANVLSTFPYGTFIANIFGCFLIGIILSYAHKTNSLTKEQTLFLATGFCGGFTTFSAFAYENFSLLKQGDILQFILYTTLSFGLGLLAILLGVFLVK